MLHMPTTNARDGLLLLLSLLIVMVQFSTVQKHNPLLLLVLLKLSFFAAVSCAKIALYLQSILYELGFACKGPTPIYEDNASTILIVNSSVLTEGAHHVYVQYFAIQDWKE